MSDLSINFCGVKFRNPLVLASGILGVTASSLKNVIRNGAGGVTTKSIWLNPHKGHPNPTMFGTEHYFINAVGLPDAGIEKAIDEINPLIESSEDPIIVSIAGGNKQDFVDIAEKIHVVNPQILELNISCPNVEDQFGRPFACVTVDAGELVKRVKEVSKNVPLVVKLSPNVNNIAEIALECEKQGADGINMGNTFGPGLVIDIDIRKPVLHNKVGGVSGPGLKPLYVKKVWDVYSAVKIPIIGTGGILTGEDAIEMMMAGASLVGVGTAVYYRDIDVFSKMVKEISDWCERSGVENLEEIVGAAH